MRKRISRARSKAIFSGTGMKTKQVNLLNYHMRGGFNF